MSQNGQTHCKKSRNFDLCSELQCKIKFVKKTMLYKRLNINGVNSPLICDFVKPWLNQL